MGMCEELYAGNQTAIAECVSETWAAGFLIFIIIFIAILFIAVYIYHAFAWMIIGKKLKYKYPWLSWIPFAATAMRLQMGGFHWAWTFLYLIPLFGWIAIFVIQIIAEWRIFEKRKYPGWFSLSQIIPSIGGVLYLIIIGLVAWKDRTKMLFD
jgi:hypothetical protein